MTDNSNSHFASLKDLPETEIQPVMFIGHGSPMNAIEDNLYSQTWKKQAAQIKKPKAILCISAHWLTRGTYLTAMDHPKTIHDFGGFPKELFDAQYPAPGSPEYAKATIELLKNYDARSDFEWGLDHGTWSVLMPMFPLHDIPVYQLSIDYYKPASYHFELAQQLKELRRRGVLVIGSGNIVHNLRQVMLIDTAYDWTIEFDEKIKYLIEQKDFESILHWEKLGESAKLSVPTPDHFYPLIYSLGLIDKKEDIVFFNEYNTMGSISMRSLITKQGL